MSSAQLIACFIIALVVGLIASLDETSGRRFNHGSKVALVVLVIGVLVTAILS